MFVKSDKRRLYWLIEQYLSNKIRESIFCDEYYYSYDLEIDKDNLTDIEKVTFAELSQVSSRFSEFEEDHKLDKNAYFTIDELRQKIIDTKAKLDMEAFAQFGYSFDGETVTKFCYDMNNKKN